MSLLESGKFTIGKTTMYYYMVPIKVPDDLGMSMYDAVKLLNPVILSKSKMKGQS